jgi:hypothetical protein
LSFEEWKKRETWKIKTTFICIVDTYSLLTKALPGKSNKNPKSDFSTSPHPQ